MTVRCYNVQCFDNLSLKITLISQIYTDQLTVISSELQVGYML